MVDKQIPGPWDHQDIPAYALPKQQVGHAEMKKLPFIIAVDFDGTLVTDKFPEIGEKNEKLFADCIRWREAGCRLVLWTCRDGQHLHKAVHFCHDHGLFFDAVNENIEEAQSLFNNDTRKVYANVYIDDKALRPSIHEVFPHYDPVIDFKPWRQTVVASKDPRYPHSFNTKYSKVGD